ncbi:MAG: hypothetical protein JNL28_12965 [Planctomycetes bacterium]|nr:hypothetical protein [Planctomycetota bacterium]
MGISPTKAPVVDRELPPSPRSENGSRVRVESEPARFSPSESPLVIERGVAEDELSQATSVARGPR